MKNLSWILLALLFFTGCESLEDTYSDMAGDGPKRYLGKCTDVTVSPGWERLRVKWVNNIDPVVVSVKLAWSSDDLTGDTILPRGTTECDIPRLKDGSYEIRVCGMDEKGNRSLEAISYGRPYTINHEVVMTFSRVISKHIFVKDRLVLFFEELPENVSDINLKYTTADGTAKVLSLTADVINAGYCLLPDAVDPSKKVTLERQGHLKESFDVIPLEPYELTHDRSFTVDFKMALEEKYGEINDALVEGLEELELDYSMMSLEDILYFPNLKKLHLAKNRFQWADDKGYKILEMYGNASQVYEPEKSLFMLNVAHEIQGITVDRYNKHYNMIPLSGLDYVTNKENPVSPAREFFDTDTWTETCSVKDLNNFKSYLEKLFDGDLNTAWQPELNGSVDVYEITVDMHDVKAVHGMQIAQRRFDPSDNESYIDIMPSLIIIQYSNDMIYWHNAARVEGNTLGNTVGEITEINFPEIRNARYLKFIVNDLQASSNFSVHLAEIRVY